MQCFKAVQRGSFRTYTMVLCVFYLLLILMFHSNLHPHQPRGLSAHVDEIENAAAAAAHVKRKEDHGVNVPFGVDREWWNAQEKAQVDEYKGIKAAPRDDYHQEAQARKAGLLKQAIGDMNQNVVNMQQVPLGERGEIPTVLGVKRETPKVDLGWGNTDRPSVAPVVPKLMSRGQEAQDLACDGAPQKDVQQFQQVAGDVFAFSVYWDTRLNDFDNLNHGSYLRIMSVLPPRVAHQKRAVYCLFNTPDTPSGITAVTATYYEMCENHNKPWGGYILSCKAPLSVKVQPCSVILSRTAEPTGGTRFKVHSTEQEEKPRDFSICISPLYGEIDPLKFVEWVELSRALGAQHITLYDYQVEGSLHDVLSYYKDLGIIDVVAWPLPAEQASERGMWYHGQLIAIQDCLYRNMGKTTYLAMNDIDEFMVPHIHKDWHEFVELADTSDTCGFQFNSAFFDPMRQESPYSGPRNYSQLFTLTNVQRSVVISKIRTKCMLKPRLIFESGIHHISKPILAHLQGQRMDVPMALLHHYRQCMGNYGMSCHKFEEDNVIPKKHSEKLYRGVSQALQVLKPALMNGSKDEALKEILKSDVFKV